MRLVILLALTLFLSVPTFGLAEEKQESCQAVCQKINEIARESSYVVFIYGYKPTDPSRNVRGGSSIGSGILIRIADENYILTSNHLVAEPLALRIWVKFVGGFMEEVRVVGRSPALDVALLSAPPIPRGVKPAEFGKPPEIGEEVFAVGYPAASRNITFGYVTSTETSPFPFYFTQAPVSPGSSGGPLLNWKKEVVGIITAMSTEAAISFVISIEDVKKVLPRLLREGVVKHGSTDFLYSNASNLLPFVFEELGLPYPPPEDYVMVTGVNPDSSAYLAGIRKGDIILEFNSRPVKSARELFRTIFFDYRPGEEVTFVVKRGNQIFKRKVVLSSAE